MLASHFGRLNEGVNNRLAVKQPTLQMPGQRPSFPVFAVGPQPLWQGPLHRILTRHRYPGVRAKYLLLC